VRIAGNIVNEDILGSMEFGCKVAGAKIIVVLGHTKCGAVKGACDNVTLGNLTSLISKIKPAVDQESVTTENRNSSNGIFVENVAELNVSLSVKNILLKSPIIAEMVKNGDIGIVGGIHDITTGEVKFFE
jgi:carbonic anhydrase